MLDHLVAREAATAFYPHLRELYAKKKSITTFGPYSPGQAVVITAGLPLHVPGTTNLVKVVTLK